MVTREVKEILARVPVTITFFPLTEVGVIILSEHLDGSTDISISEWRKSWERIG